MVTPFPSAETPHKSHRVAESEYRETTSMPPPPDVAPLPADKFDTNMQYRASDIDCLVKLYDFRQTGCQGDEDDHSPTVRLNDMIEVIGVFSAYADVSVDAERNFSDPNAMTMALLSGDPFFGFESSANIPRKLVNVPTVHCIIYRKLCSAYPLYYSPVDGSANAKKYLSGHGNVFARLEDSDEYSLAHGECFNSLVSRLSSALGGDDLSAAYVALSVISSVSGRAPGDLVLGALSVNLHGFLPADNRIGMLINVLTEIAPRVVSVSIWNVV